MGFSRRFLLHALCLSALAVFSVSVSPAQLLQGTIDGNVTDPSQAAVAGATVTVTNQGTTLSRDTVTNSLGEYTLPTLPPGTYTLSVKAGGFGPYSQTGVVVNANEVTRVNIALAVGQVKGGGELMAAFARELKTLGRHGRSPLSSPLPSGEGLPSGLTRGSAQRAG